ncbi:hypothetical protein B0O99DRAFT_685157 [Bisporella sp. PMI_857]|nr:hypothetical protein B0O99DRAFT_685157 [Bisporella sp. PMI_857]
MSDSNKNFLFSEVSNVKGKVAPIIGRGSGIGLMATQALAVSGARVYIVSRTQEKLDALVKFHGQGIAGKIIPIIADVTQKSEISRLVKEIESREHCLCILINNAGISGNTQQTEAKTAEEMKNNLFNDESSTFEDWQSTYKDQSPTAIFLDYGIFTINASKAAAIHLTKMLASEVAENDPKVRINSIAPGVFPSEMTTGSKSDEMQKSHIEKNKYARVPARRPGKDEDMAGAILFVATNQYLNGQTVAVDGGYILHAVA